MTDKLNGETYDQSVARKEEEGRRIASELIYSFITPSTTIEIHPIEQRYSHKDLRVTYTTPKNKKIETAVEVKYRDVDYEQYPTVLIEQIKYKGLLKDEEADAIRYINIYNVPNGYNIKVFNLREDRIADLPTTSIYSRRNNFDKDRVKKTMIELPNEWSDDYFLSTVDGSVTQIRKKS